MGKENRSDLIGIHNALQLRLLEAAKAGFGYHGRNRHWFNRIFLVRRTSEESSCVINHSAGIRHELTAGTAYFMPPAIDLEFHFEPDLEFLSFHFNLLLPERRDLFLGVEISAQLPASAETDNAAGLLNAPPGDAAAAVGIAALLPRLALRFAEVTGTAGENRLHRYEALLAFLEDEADARTTVDQLAEVAGMPRDTLSRRFPRDCGVTLKQALSQSLIRRAERLLLLPGTTARETARALGFGSEYYFNRFFRQHTGRTPGEYRRGTASR